MQNFTNMQKLSMITAAIAGLAGFIATLGQIWGFEAIAGQISETCFATSGFASIVFGGSTLQKGIATKKEGK